MAQIIGSLRPKPSYGERQVFDLLRHLPDDYIVWPERNLKAGHPDFIVLHPRIGLLVLEIKDWKQILEANPDEFLVQPFAGESFRATNPIKRVWQLATGVADVLQAEPRLLHSDGRYQGKLVIPWDYAVVFTHLPSMDLYWMRQVIEPERVISKDDLATPERFEQRLQQLPWLFQTSLDSSQVDLVRRTLYPEVKIPHRDTGTDTGATLDIEQEKVAKEGLYEHLQDDELSPEGTDAGQNLTVRMVRGVAGSGKTLVLGLRAKLLAEAHPDWRILVVSYNKSLASYLRRQFSEMRTQIHVTHFHSLCTRWLNQANLWGQPISERDQVGWIQRVLDINEHGNAYDTEFLRDEFNWMKDTGNTTLESYLAAARVGRGTRLTKEERELVYQIFEDYQRHLKVHHCMDWSDIPLYVLEAIDHGLLSVPQYEAILVDEAQDFAPSWFEVLKQVLNPQTSVLFMAADAAQRIYQKFTWKSVGLNVMGRRTRILRRAYRNTFEIMYTAYETICRNETLLRELEEQEEQLLNPELSDAVMRHGEYPLLKQCQDSDTEEQFIANQIRRLIADGYAPGDIAVLSRKYADVSSLKSGLKEQGLSVAVVTENNGHEENSVSLCTLHSAKGLEYRVVFVTNLASLFDMSTIRTQEERDEFEANEMRLLYVGMTRARDRLYLTYRGTLPRQLHPLKVFLSAAQKVETG